MAIPPAAKSRNENFDFGMVQRFETRTRQSALLVTRDYNGKKAGQEEAGGKFMCERNA